MDNWNGWAFTLSIWGVVCFMAYLLKISKTWVQAYRIRKGRMQMNEWLEMVGKHLDIVYAEGTPYSRNALKKWLAEVSVMYFKNVIKKNTE